MWHDPHVVQGPNRTGALAPETASPAEETAPVAAKRAARIIAGPRPEVDPAKLERERAVARILAAQGRPAVTRAVDEFLASKHELPHTQAVWLQVLEHRDESKVMDAIAALHALIAEEAVLRRAVLESRLRRIEELADEPTTRTAAAELRRFIQGRPSDDTGSI